mmetsp:Transcript_5151/g.12666  ORF Transcript_5151/g.12666 Transcript_5151/m.12666 type:complete len:218 (-) Transcript_5151:319-972(-)|eukprot:CAMPEP_0202867730 /NCGR_PEP_ID=MMETSP1391-20130828/9592_1 /ASSEMBLY_ACC=CAM_ASM_000867 /TAXON_ID=1034604 /ORGANISM="Chlamydomonas leiostraca, Strain SAG 11-49" /LENGTH=217 /DNA_ID=CAMNT_0049547793 /DNA_START=81 /DNA_END=734 /DNA_ORIENTATION=-
MVQLFAQLIGGVRLVVDSDTPTTAAALVAKVAETVGRPVASFKLVHKGTVVSDTPEALIKLAEGDTVLVVPNRTAPNPSLVRTVLAARAGGGGDDDDEEEDDEPAQLPATAQRWEHKVIALAKRQRVASWVVEWLVVLRPLRILLLLLFLVAANVANRFSLGPVFILLAMIAAIFAGLGKKREGEASAYSIFNPGVQRLPGQLDADQIDQQIRHGHI